MYLTYAVLSCGKEYYPADLSIGGKIRYFAKIFCIQCVRQNPRIFSLYLTKHIQRRELTLQHAASLIVITGNIVVGRWCVG